MSTTYTVGDHDFSRLMNIPELRADPLFNQAIAAYGRHVAGDKRKCCGGGKHTDSREYITVAGAALRRLASSDPRKLAALIRRSFGLPDGTQITLSLGSGVLLIE